MKTSTKLWIDPPSGWRYGFPKTWDQTGDMNEWLLSEGYPQQEIDACGNFFYVRQWLDEADTNTKEIKMAKTKTVVSKVSDKLAKVNENFNVNMYDNGFMLEVSGKDADNEYKTAKIMVSTSEQLLVLIAEVAEMERDS
jgi:hypothetical protein